MLSSKELKEHFELSLVQYMTIDKNKSEHFGSLVQGFFGIKKGEQAHIIPFEFSDDDSMQKVMSVLNDIQTDYFGVSFVQHYIHYTHS